MIKWLTELFTPEKYTLGNIVWLPNKPFHHDRCTLTTNKTSYRGKCCDWVDLTKGQMAPTSKSLELFRYWEAEKVEKEAHEYESLNVSTHPNR